MIANKSMDIKYNIFANEIKETFLSENQTSIYKRNVKIKNQKENGIIERIYNRGNKERNFKTD